MSAPPSGAGTTTTLDQGGRRRAAAASSSAPPVAVALARQQRRGNGVVVSAILRRHRRRRRSTPRRAVLDIVVSVLAVVTMVGGAMLGRLVPAALGAGRAVAAAAAFQPTTMRRSVATIRCSSGVGGAGAHHHRRRRRRRPTGIESAASRLSSSSDGSRLSSSSDGSGSRSRYSAPALVDGSSVAIVGGGLAGLSAAHHLLRRAAEGGNVRLSVTVLDREEGPGIGGASAVAGGLLHPFSPRGTLLHNGLQSLAASNALLTAALHHEPTAVLRNTLYRVALTDKNASQLRSTATKYPRHATWLDSDEMVKRSGCRGDEKTILGGVELGGGCRVVHVPTYLRGLWASCREMAAQVEGGGSATWVTVPHHDDDDDRRAASVAVDGLEWGERLAQYDAVILSAGSGLFTDAVVLRPAPTPVDDDSHDDEAEAEEEAAPVVAPRYAGLPIDLVRGQSVELTLPVPDPVPDPAPLTAKAANGDGSQPPTTHVTEAILCGKYIVPLPPPPSGGSKNKVLVGATHEFKLNEPLTPSEVVAELRSRTEGFLDPAVWGGDEDEDDTTGEGSTTTPTITGGIRVQSHRGQRGRLPIVGRVPEGVREALAGHDNAWLFTGLGGRGLIYHGIYGEALAELMMLPMGGGANADADAVAVESKEERADDDFKERYPDLDWWRRTRKSKKK